MGVGCRIWGEGEGGCRMRDEGEGGCCRNSLHRNKSGRFSLAPCQGIKDKKSCFERAVTSTDYLLQLAC